MRESKFLHKYRYLAIQETQSELYYGVKQLIFSFHFFFGVKKNLSLLVECIKAVHKITKLGQTWRKNGIETT